MTTKDTSQVKGDKIKSAIAKSKKTNFEKAFENSSLSKSPGNSTTAPKSGKSNASYEIGTNSSGGGNGFREDLDYVAGVASRAAEKAASLRSRGQQDDRSYQTNVDRTNRDNAVADRNLGIDELRSQRATDRSNFLFDQSNANSRVTSVTKNEGPSATEKEMAFRAGQSAAALRNQRNNQLLGLARGGL